MLGLLRDEPASRTPEPDLGRLPELLAVHRGSGMRLTAEIAGLDQPPPLASRTAYRIVSEALTNAQRHGTEGPVELHVDGTGGQVRIDCWNPLRSPVAPSRGRHAGHGLDGVQERVRLFGGTTSAGRDATDRWHLHATLSERGAAVTIRVLVVDDEPLVRHGLRTIIDSEPDLEVVGEAGDGAQALAETRRLAPDLVCMDVRMPDVDGIRATELVLALAHPPRVLVVTTFSSDDYVFGALRAGASGFVLKRASADELVAAVRAVASGDSLLYPAAVREMALKSVVPERYSGTPLTSREREVLGLVAEGLGNAAIAERMTVGVETVRTHVAGGAPQARRARPYPRRRHRLHAGPGPAPTPARLTHRSVEEDQLVALGGHALRSAAAPTSAAARRRSRSASRPRRSRGGTAR